MENLSDGKDINRAWENIKENNKTSAKEGLSLYKLKQHKPWFGEECLGFLGQRKQAKMQWIQDSSQSDVDNLNNVRYEASRYFKNMKEYLKAKIHEFETNSNYQKYQGPIYWGISYFKKGYQPRTNIIKDEKGIWLQIPTAFWLCGGNISLSY